MTFPAYHVDEGMLRISYGYFVLIYYRSYIILHYISGIKPLTIFWVAITFTFTHDSFNVEQL